MGALLDGRRRNLARAGRSMTLKRTSGEFPTVTTVSVTVLGFSRAYRADPLAGTLIQADFIVEILNDEIAASGTYTGPPRKDDLLTMDGAEYAVVGVETIHEASATIGHRLMVRGG